MPVAIIMLPDAVPAIIEKRSAAELEAAVRALPGCAAAPAGLDGLKAWFGTLPAPSGWFASTEEAQAHVERTNQVRGSVAAAGKPASRAPGDLLN